MLRIVRIPVTLAAAVILPLRLPGGVNSAGSRDDNKVARRLQGLAPLVDVVRNL